MNKTLYAEVHCKLQNGGGLISPLPLLARSPPPANPPIFSFFSNTEDYSTPATAILSLKTAGKIFADPVS